MRLASLTYRRSIGWSAPFPEMNTPHQLVTVFGATSYIDDPEPIRELVAEYPDAMFIGCSTAGEVHGMALEDESLAVAVVEFDTTAVRFATAPTSAQRSHAAGAHLGAELAADDLKAMFVLSEGLDVNGSELVRGIRDTVGEWATITGGLAGDGDRFDRTWVLVDGKPASGHVSAIGLYGPSVVVGHGSRGGWDIFGPERTITRSTDNVLYELDGRPALDLYKEYLGEFANQLPATGLLFPLELRERGSDTRLVRTILAIDEEERSLTFAGDMPEGNRAQLMQANFDRLVGGAEEAGQAAAVAAATGPGLCIAISCVGRRLVLGERTEDELEATQHSLPDGTTQVGFYSYGEISPYAAGTCELHNQTMTLTTIYEAA